MDAAQLWSWPAGKLWLPHRICLPDPPVSGADVRAALRGTALDIGLARWLTAITSASAANCCRRGLVGNYRCLDPLRSTRQRPVAIAFAVRTLLVARDLVAARVCPWSAGIEPLLHRARLPDVRAPRAGGRAALWGAPFILHALVEKNAIASAGAAPDIVLRAGRNGICLKPIRSSRPRPLAIAFGRWEILPVGDLAGSRVLPLKAGQ